MSLSLYPVTRGGTKIPTPSDSTAPAHEVPHSSPPRPGPCCCSLKGPHPLPSGLQPFCLFLLLSPSDCCSWSPQLLPLPSYPLPCSFPPLSLWECLGVEGGKPVNPLPWWSTSWFARCFQYPCLTWTLPITTRKQSYITVIRASERLRQLPEATQLLKWGSSWGQFPSSLLIPEPVLLTLCCIPPPTPCPPATGCHSTRGRCHSPFFFRAFSSGPSPPTKNMAAGIFLLTLVGLAEWSLSASLDPACVDVKGSQPPPHPESLVPLQIRLTFLLYLSYLGSFPCWHLLLLNAQRFWWGDRASQVTWKCRVGIRQRRATFQPIHYFFSPQGGPEHLLHIFLTLSPERAG